MNGKIKFMIPAFAAVFALMFVFATPNVMAEGGDYSKWGGADHHKHMKIQLGELSGSESVTRETIHDKKDEVISLSIATSNYPDAKKASLGIAVNDVGEKFLIWKVVTMTKTDDGAKSATIHVVDALKGYEITSIEKSFDRSSMDGKWSNHGMKDKFAELSSEEREAKFTQFKEMKQAFSSISDEDRELIKTHFKEMKQEYVNLSDEEKDAKHTEFKSQMEEFSVLSLDEKIAHLQEFANSLK
ncbi:MAG: DUF3106 domain-containing protein [Nitrosopumilus sp.]|nr:DUF3106 domain-containing protein [Nitrosopumilus sp.]MDH3486642.1 DUF3106 domain-containing protein [Nitrosopumilus sp.]